MYERKGRLRNEKKSNGKGMREIVLSASFHVCYIWCDPSR